MHLSQRHRGLKKVGGGAGSCIFMTELQISDRRLRMLKISILPLNSPKLGISSLRIGIFGRILTG